MLSLIHRYEVMKWNMILGIMFNRDKQGESVLMDDMILCYAFVGI